MPSTPTKTACFDYYNLDAETAKFVQQQTGVIQRLIKRSAQSIVMVGQKLIEVKARLGHGRFLSWIQAEFEWSEPTAQRFMRVAQYFKSVNLTDLTIAPSALYVLAAPSTSEAVREEALARAEAGESITHTTVKTIKQKYASCTSKPKSEPAPKLVLQPIPQAIAPSPDSSVQPGSKLKIVGNSFQSSTPASASASKLPGVWWRLGGRHLLYCGEPNSPEFLARVKQEEVSMLLAFPPTPNWQPSMIAKVRLIFNYLPQGKDLRSFEDALETLVLLYSRLENTVVSCFLPTSEILSTINRLNRWGLFAEPDEQRCKMIVSDWKKSGLKAQRIS